VGDAVKTVIILISAYIIGSIPFALIVGKKIGGIDVRNYGSGNLGGTNAFRILGWKVGVPVIVADILKDSLIDTLTINKKNEKFNAFFADLMKNAEIENKLAEEAEQKKETQNE
jgi:acyl-phosphate glycerol 3-phosphate acyltransferase